MFLLWTLSIASILVLFLQYSKADCETPNGRIGNCMPLTSCPSLSSLAADINHWEGDGLEKEVVFLKNSRCTNIDETESEPYVCCPQINPEVREHLENLPCGTTAIKKIANGTPAPLFSYRFMALLKYSDNTFRCGASLIDERHVLTAAHCMKKDKPIAVRLGEYNLDTEIDCVETNNRTLCLHPYEDIDIEEIIPHDRYKYLDKDYHNDIAIIRLKNPVKFDRNHIVPICLPITKELQDERNDVNSEYTVAGWGLTQYNNRSKVLLYTSVPLQTQEFCKEKLGLSLDDDHICAGGKQFRDSCRGDSGGPLFASKIFVDDVARLVQYGIFNVGEKNCGSFNLPAVYTDVSRHLQWITDHIKIYQNNSSRYESIPSVFSPIFQSLSNQ